ncbi:hypothetical protein ES705_50969 [subsurface metagenome]
MTGASIGALLEGGTVLALSIRAQVKSSSKSVSVTEKKLTQEQLSGWSEVIAELHAHDIVGATKYTSDLPSVATAIVDIKTGRIYAYTSGSKSILLDPVTGDLLATTSPIPSSEVISHYGCIVCAEPQALYFAEIEGAIRVNMEMSSVYVRPIGSKGIQAGAAVQRCIRCVRYTAEVTKVPTDR